MRIRNVDALVVAHHAAVEHAADDVRPINAFHLHPNQTVVNQNAAADGNVLRQFLVGDGHALFVALHLVSREGEQLAVLQRDTPIFERTHANFRALGIQHRGDRQPQFIADAAYFIVIMLMRFISAVRKLKRATFMPAFISGAIRCFSNRFGPIVQTIFVLRIGVFTKTIPHFHRILSYYIIQILCCESPAIKL